MIKNIFKNFLYKASGEPIVKIEKNNSENSGINDLNIQDDNNSPTNIVNSSNQLNAVDVIELISDDEDDSLQIVEINDDETPACSVLDVTSPVSELSNLASHDSETENNMMLVNNKNTFIEDHRSLIEGVSNSNESMNQGPVKQNVVDSASADNSREICNKYEADCRQKITNSSNVLSSLIISSPKTDCSNENGVDKSLMFVDNKETSIIQHQVSNTTITTTKNNKFYIISNPYIKPIQLGSPKSTNDCPQNTDILKCVTPKKKIFPKVLVENVTNLTSNSQNILPRLLLYNPVNKISVSINGIISSTPVARENKKSVGASLKINHSNVLVANKSNNPSVTRGSVYKKIDKNIKDKVTKAPSTIVQIENSQKPLAEINQATTNTSTSHQGATPSTTVNSFAKDGNTISGSDSSQTTVPEPGNSCTTPTISFNKKNNMENKTSTSTPNPSSPKITLVRKKSNTILTSSIGVQTDLAPESVPKNLKRKATDDDSQDATASFSHNQGAPPAKKQKIQSSEVSDVIIHLDGKSANRIEISNELLENGQERQVVSQFFEKISSVVIVQPPSTTQSIIKIINKSLRNTNENSATNDATSRTDGDNNISNNNETLLNKDSREESSKNQEAASSNESVNNNEKSSNKDSNGNERSMNENLNNSQTLNQSIINEKSDNNSHSTKENLNNTNLNANIKIQKNEPIASTSTSPTETVNKNVKSENNFGSSFSPSGWVQYGTRLLNRTDRICFTGDIDEKRQTAIEKLGGQITNDPLDATVLVADKFRRTFKFICAICRSIPIVSTQWINESIIKNDFVNPYEYILKDEEAEKNYSFQLEESLMKAKKKQLFRDYTVLITSSVNRPSVNELKTIVKLAGGRALVRAPKYWGPKSMIISCDDDGPKVRKILEKKPQDILCPVVSADFVLSSLLKQDLEINTKNLKVEKKS